MLTTYAKLLALALMLVLPGLEARAAGLIRDAEIERTLDRLADPLFGAAGLSPQTVDLYIINDPELNAFVAGGRNIFLHTGMLMEFETPEELAGVIAHEVGHIAGGHLARRSITLRNARGPALVGVLLGIAAGAAGSGDVAGAVISGSQGAVQRTLLRFSRAEEAAADQAGLGYMTRAGLSPEGMLKVLQMFRGQEVFLSTNTDPYALTHPLSAERLQLIERRAAEVAGRYPSDPTRDYWHRRMRAKLSGFLDSPERVLDRLDGQPETEEVLLARAVALHRMADTRSALTTVDRLIAMRPADPFYIELKGQILHEAGRAAEAVPLYREAVRLAPREPLIRAGLGRALLALDTPASNAEALRVLEEARNADGTDPSSLRDLALAYGRAGDQGMATLATAERFALTGRMADAQLHAGRAAVILPQGSPGWLRAQDILAMKIDD